MSLSLFETKSPLSLLGRFAWPAIVSLLANALYNVVDRAFVGHLVGTEALAAVSVVFPFSLLTLGFGLALGAGASTLVSLSLGKKDPAQANRVLGQVLVLVGGLSAVLVLVFLPTVEPLLRALGTPSDVVRPARDFFFTSLWGLPFQLLSMGLGMPIRSQGRAKTSMFLGLVGIGLNTVFCTLFVDVWGLQGSAWATVLAQLISGVLALTFYFTPLSSLRPTAVVPNPALMARLASLGAPSLLFQIINVGLMFLLNLRVQQFGGENAIAAVGIVNSLSGLFFMPILGLVQGALPLFGYNQGAGRTDRNRVPFRWVLGLGTAFFSACTVVVEFFPRVLLSIFTQDEHLVAFAIEPLRVFLLLTPLATLQFLPSHYFQAVGRPKPAIVLSLIRPAALFALVLVLPLFWGFSGFLAAGPLSDAAGIAAATALVLGERTLKGVRVEG